VTLERPRFVVKAYADLWFFHDDLRDLYARMQRGLSNDDIARMLHSFNKDPPNAAEIKLAWRPHPRMCL